MLTGLARAVLYAPKAIIVAAFALALAATIAGFPVIGMLSAGGFDDPGSESHRADQVLSEKLDRGGMQLVLLLHSSRRDDQRVKAVADDLVQSLQRSPDVQDVKSFWTTGMDPSLVSRDQKSTMVVASVSGGEEHAPQRAQRLADSLVGSRDGIEVSSGGQAIAFNQINETTQKNLLVADAIAIPLTFLVLCWVFGSIIAALLPIIVGLFAIVGTMAGLRVIASVTDVSVYALNLTTLLGLALAIDYTLFIVSRFREEVASGRSTPDAINVALRTAGRTVIFSAVTVGLSLAAIAVFPMYFLRSFAYAGVFVVVLAAAASLILAPAFIVVVGPRLNSYNIRRPLSRIGLGRRNEAKSLEDTFWYRLATCVMRRPVFVAATVIAILLLLGAPFLGVKFGFPDDRVLPTSASSHLVGDKVRSEFDASVAGETTVVLNDSSAVSADELASYVRRLSLVKGVLDVRSDGMVATSGRVVRGSQTTSGRSNITVLAVSASVDPFAAEGRQLVSDLHEVRAPVPVLFTGLAQQNVDNVDGIVDRVPLVLVLIFVSTFLLLFLFTGSVFLPFKAILLNCLSLSATFGAMVWVFQDGHLSGLGTTTTGSLIVSMPPLMFCVAFGLSMDYEVFILSRIREEAVRLGFTSNRQSVVLGIAKTGRIVSAAAILMAIVFATIMTSDISFMRMFGFGLAVAVLVDASLVRGLLVPAFMALAGRANWWLPGPLRSFHSKFGLDDFGL